MKIPFKLNSLVWDARFELKISPTIFHIYKEGRIHPHDPRSNVFGNCIETEGGIWEIHCDLNVYTDVFVE